MHSGQSLSHPSNPLSPLPPLLSLCPRRLAPVSASTRLSCPLASCWVRSRGGASRRPKGGKKVRSEHLLYHLLSCRGVGWQWLRSFCEGHSPCLQPWPTAIALVLSRWWESLPHYPDPCLCSFRTRCVSGWPPHFVSLWCFTIPFGFSSLWPCLCKAVPLLSSPQLPSLSVPSIFSWDPNSQRIEVFEV